MDARDLEVRCDACGAGFAAGTPECIHCGRKLPKRRARRNTDDLGRSRERADDDEPFAELSRRDPWRRADHTAADRSDWDASSAPGRDSGSGAAPVPSQRRAAGSREPEPESELETSGMMGNLVPGAIAIFFVLVSYLLRACGAS